MQKNRAQKVIVKQKNGWNEQECRKRREWIEALFDEQTEEDDNCDVSKKEIPACSGNAPPVDGKL